jgi:uncharacterized protein YndB with AHSA1/START domain
MATKITINAIVNAPLSIVWDKYTNPTHIINWNFASDDWCCPRAENNLVVGGKFFARMEAKDGSFGFDMEWIYDEVIDQQKFSYSGDGRTISTEFKNLGETTEVITLFDAEEENSIELQKNGWQAILDNFKKYVEGGI